MGQRFSKMFDIDFQDPSDPTGKKREHAYQNSWGLSQRSLGALIMVHGDDKGLVLPPRLACHQVVIVPVGLKASSSEEEMQKVKAKCMEYYMKLTSAGVRVKLDDRTAGGISPGWKFNHWEMKGVPLRMELGPADIEKGQFVLSKRNILDKSAKITGKDGEVVEQVQQVLEDIHSEMYSKALADRDACVASVDEWKDFSPELNRGKVVLIPFCGAAACEEMIKEKTKLEATEMETVGDLKMGAKGLCVPHEEKYNLNCPWKCINPDCPSKGHKVQKRTLFGRSY